MDARGRDVCGTELYISKVVVDSHRVRADVTVTEILRDAIQLEQLDLISGSERRQILLIALKVDLKVLSGAIGGALRKKWLSGRSVGSRKRDRNDRIMKWHRYIGMSTCE